MFKKSVVIECEAFDIEQLIVKHYPQYKGYELYADEEHDNSVMVKHVDANDVEEFDQDEFSAGKTQYMAHVILDKLCFDGHIESGKYLIDGTW